MTLNTASRARRILQYILAGTVSCFVGCLAAQNANAKDFYVSKSGNNQDGLSFATAFNELSRINWNVVGPTDTIIIDGGTTQMTYTTGLKIAKTGTTAQPLRIQRSTVAGHNGKVIIDGQGQPNFVGIDFTGNGYVGNVDVDGLQWNGIEVRNCDRGVKLSCYSNWNDHVYGLDVHHNKTGILIEGSNGAGWCNVRDNQVNNVLITNPNNAVYPGDGLTNCQIYMTTGQADGINMSPGFLNGGTNVINCVLGPNLRHGLSMTSTTSVKLTSCLFLNAQQANINQADYTGRITVERCTSFMTSLNNLNQAHSALQLARISSYNNTINSSIFYGGTLTGNTFQYGSNNTQFRTSGNTMMVRGRTADPQFVTDVSGFPNNVPDATLNAANFALRAGSPAVGTGSAITSVSTLRSTKRPGWN
jgi:hypothetical protein